MPTSQIILRKGTHARLVSDTDMRIGDFFLKHSISSRITVLPYRVGVPEDVRAVLCKYFKKMQKNKVGSEFLPRRWTAMLKISTRSNLEGDQVFAILGFHQL